MTTTNEQRFEKLTAKLETLNTYEEGMVAIGETWHGYCRDTIGDPSLTLGFCMGLFIRAGWKYWTVRETIEFLATFRSLIKLPGLFTWDFLRGFFSSRLERAGEAR